MTDAKVEKLSFYTLGPEFTELLRNFLREGRFKTVYEILEDGGMAKELIKEFFYYKVNFTGDTRKGDLNVEFNERSEPDFDETLYYALRTLLSFEEKEIHQIRPGDFENIDYLTKIIPWEEVLQRTYKRQLTHLGFGVLDKPNKSHNHTVDGAILEDGTFIECGYQQHNELYRYLSALNLADDYDWTRDNVTLHISSGSVGGNKVNVLRYPESSRYDAPTDEQLISLFKFRSNLNGLYGEHESITEVLRDYVSTLENNGGKYGNLLFLKRFYSNRIKLPVFSREPLETEKQSIRTSPKYSLPGLLNSKFEVTDIKAAVDEIKSDWEKVKDLRKGNELHMFYQEYLPGINGVCNYSEKDGFSYSCSNKQGAVVQGAEGEIKLEAKHFQELKSFCRELYEDLQQRFQLEFVVSNDNLYIVQLRILENEPEETVIGQTPKDVITFGKTFSKGTIEVPVKDILIVESEAKPEELLGKEALVVTSDVAFSHILALSKALKIPSIYATGPIDLSAYKKVKFTAYNKEGFISKI